MGTAKMTAEILGNGGDSWCTCACCTAEVIGKVGCEAMEFNCDATDLSFIMADTTADWEPLRQCLRTQCPGPLTSLSLTGPALVAPARLSVATIAAAVAACVSLVAALGLLALRLRSGMARDRH